MIEFTQFLRPNGQETKVHITRSPEVEGKAYAIIQAGYRLEIEMLTTGEVSATIADPAKGEDVAHARIVEDGPEVPEVIDEMILNFVIPGSEEAAAADPLDHDGDGKAGGSLSGEQSTARKGRKRKQAEQTAEPVIEPTPEPTPAPLEGPPFQPIQDADDHGQPVEPPIEEQPQEPVVEETEQQPQADATETSETAPE